jgi:hypothetical protein
MDDFEKIRSAFPEQPGPSPEVTDQARRQVQALAREAATVRRRDRWHAAARSGRVGMALTATAATVALAALATPLLLSPGTEPDTTPVPGTGSPAVRLSAVSRVLLAAAVLQEDDEKASGEYFRVRSMHTNLRTTVGKPGQTYQLERRKIFESWTPASTDGRSWFGYCDLGARPATAADKAKWRAQGSPDSWRLHPDDTPITVAAGPPELRQTEYDDVPRGYFLNDEKPLTAAQIRALPTDPSKLRALLGSNQPAGASATDRDYAVFSAASRLLFELPSPPKLRGAALRVLADLPGTVLREGVKDPIGRTGTEISFEIVRRTSQGRWSDTFTNRLIIDPATGRLLSSQLRSPLKSGGTVVLEAGWTDEEPTAPAAAVR